MKSMFHIIEKTKKQLSVALVFFIALSLVDSKHIAFSAIIPPQKKPAEVFFDGYSRAENSSTKKKVTKNNNGIVQRPNISFLKDLKINMDQESREFNKKVLDKKAALNIRQEYQDINREYEFKQGYGLNSQQDHIDYFKRAKNFARYAVHKILSFQFESNMKEAEKNSEDVKTFNTVRTTVESVAKGTTTVSEGASFKFGTKANLPDQHGQVWMKSNVVDGAFDVNVGQPWAIDPFSFEKKDPFQKQREGYKVSLGRKLPVWDLASGLSYGGTSQTVTGTLSKQLTQHLSTEVSSTRDVNDFNGKSSKNEEVVKMLFGTRF